MKIQFKKIPITGVDFDAKIDDLRFCGVVKKISENLVKCKGVIEGNFDHNCDRCNEQFQENVKEEIDIFISKGIYHDGEKLLNLIEVFDDFVNFDTILESELESYRCDYLYCENCK
ncbi:MAG: DNA-binding protein [Epsilonproteobacteria bacterium]|nr:DNA-binding protein [Campylobacterota bacterium]